MKSHEHAINANITDTSRNIFSFGCESYTSMWYICKYIKKRYVHLKCVSNKYLPFKITSHIETYIRLSKTSHTMLYMHYWNLQDIIIIEYADLCMLMQYSVHKLVTTFILHVIKPHFIWYSWRGFVSMSSALYRADSETLEHILNFKSTTHNKFLYLSKLAEIHFVHTYLAWFGSSLSFKTLRTWQVLRYRNRNTTWTIVLLCSGNSFTDIFYSHIFGLLQDYECMNIRLYNIV